MPAESAAVAVRQGDAVECSWFLGDVNRQHRTPPPGPKKQEEVHGVAVSCLQGEWHHDFVPAHAQPLQVDKQTQIARMQLRMSR